MSKRTLVVGNWKMNPATLEEARTIIRKTRHVAAELIRTDVVMCPPFVFISAGSTRADSAHSYLGAQSVSRHREEGSHTGEVGIHMLRDMNVEYVIVGHSEERARGVTDADVAQTVAAVVQEGLTAIVCVGEHARDEGGLYLDTLKEQIRNSVLNVSAKYAKNIIIAYEPIWAIGAQEAMNPERVYEMMLFVKKVFADIFDQDIAMKMLVLYGGAVNAENAANIIKIGKADGLLVGRESVRPEGFAELLKAVDAISDK
jgi:triosephosphate isomerase